jgi:hypothetical protein
VDGVQNAITQIVLRFRSRSLHLRKPSSDGVEDREAWIHHHGTHPEDGFRGKVPETSSDGDVTGADPRESPGSGDAPDSWIGRLETPRDGIVVLVGQPKLKNVALVQLPLGGQELNVRDGRLRLFDLRRRLILNCPGLPRWRGDRGFTFRCGRGGRGSLFRTTGDDHEGGSCEETLPLPPLYRGLDSGLTRAFRGQDSGPGHSDDGAVSGLPGPRGDGPYRELHSHFIPYLQP